MTDNIVYITILFCLLVTELFYAVLYIRASWYYFTDGADMRVCSLAQYFIYGLLFTSEVVSYLITGQTSVLFIFVARTHLIFSFFLLASCRLVGYRTIYSSSLFRNVLYIILCFFFYFTIIMGNATLEIPSTNRLVNTDNLLLLSKVSLYIQTLNNYPSSIFVEFIPVIFSLACYIIILSFDLKEKRSNRTFIMDLILGISILLFIIAKVGTSVMYLDNLITCFMYIIPIFGFTCEARSVIKICRFMSNEDKTFIKLIKSSITMSNIKQKYNARLAAKLISKKPELESIFPKGKKYKKFRDIVDSFLKSNEGHEND